MINTYQTSAFPPPVPPRLNRSGAVLMPSRGHSKVLLGSLVLVVLLNVLLSFGGFFYLYLSGRTGTSHQNEAKTALLSSEETSHTAMARMVIKQPSQTLKGKPELGYLEWNIVHSVRRNVNPYQASWLTVLQPGDYYVYARVTFSGRDPKLPLACRVKLRQSDKAEEKDVMKAYCSLESGGGQCTAAQGEVLTLQPGNQLSVWVQDLNLVDYEEGATAFGMYKM